MEASWSIIHAIDTLASSWSGRPPPTLEWAPQNHTWRRSVVTWGGRSHSAGGKDVRFSSKASAWKAYSIVFVSEVSENRHVDGGQYLLVCLVLG